MQVSMDDFKQVIRKCRSRETSADPERRSDKNPSYRQCLVTAILANEFLGLDIYKEIITLEDRKRRKHYFNKDKKNISIRFCEEQLAYEHILSRKKERIFTNGDVEFTFEVGPIIKERYEILKQKFQEKLFNNFIDGFITDFTQARFDMIDDLPPYLLEPHHPNYYKYKCRTARWQVLSTKMEILRLQLTEGCEEIKKEMQEFMEYMRNIDFKKFRTKEEIDHANVFLERIIALLEKAKQLKVDIS